MRITADAVRYVTTNTFYSARPNAIQVNERRFLGYFGCNPPTVARIWNIVDSRLEELSDASMILWLLTTLYFFRHYPTTTLLASKVDKDEEVVRVNLWIWVDYLQTLDLVCEFLGEPRYSADRAYEQLIHETANDPTQRHILEHHIRWWNDHGPPADQMGEQADAE